MADEEKKEAEGGDKGEAEKAKGKPLIKFILIGVVAVVILGAAGFFFLKGDPSDSESSEKIEEEIDQEDEEDMDKSVAIYDLDPFVVNLADRGDVRYLKISIKLEMKKDSYLPRVDKHLAAIRDSMLILLSSKDFESIRTVEGKLQLRDEIIHRINTILKGRLVKTAYFTEFVSQ